MIKIHYYSQHATTSNTKNEVYLKIFPHACCWKSIYLRKIPLTSGSSIRKVCCFSDTWVFVSGRNSAPGMHFELKRNIHFCDKNSKFRPHGPTPVAQTIGFVSNSFCDLNTRSENHDREKHIQNTIGANEFTCGALRAAEGGVRSTLFIKSQFEHVKKHQ